MIGWAENNKKLRDRNIAIAKERGRGELKDDDKESTKITSSQVNKYKRRKKKWSKKQLKKS